MLMAGSFALAALPNARYCGRCDLDAWRGADGRDVAGTRRTEGLEGGSVRLSVHDISGVSVPCLLRLDSASGGSLAYTGVGLELIGVALTQVSRVYMDRSFGILPGNRGIVSKGPFRLVRHPIHAGWFLLTLGYIASYASMKNLLIMLATLPFMM
jgi:protein-S-isoprenylcysteine O-methyltransferase Ste14